MIRHEELTTTELPKAVAKKRSLTKTSQLFQGESSYKLFKRVAINFLVEPKLCKAVQQDSPRSLIEKYWNCERFT